MRSFKGIAAAASVATVVSGCGSTASFEDRELPNISTVVGKHLTSVSETRAAVEGLQDQYQRLIGVYNADSNNFSFTYLAAATATAAAAIFGAHPDVLKGLALFTGTAAGAESILAPEKKRDALYAAEKKLSCVAGATLALLSVKTSAGSGASKVASQRSTNLQRAVQNASATPVTAAAFSRAQALHEHLENIRTTPKAAVSYIVTTVRDIHFTLLEEFKGGRIDYKAQADAYIAAAKAAAELSEKKSETKGAVTAAGVHGDADVIALQNDADREASYKAALSEVRKCAL